MTSLLFAVSAVAPLTFAGVTAGFVSVAMLASYVPALRAATVDPVAALQAEQRGPLGTPAQRASSVRG